MKSFKKFCKYSLPIVMSDRHSINTLEEVLSSLDDTGLAYSELEDYITDLRLIEQDFICNISNNLKLKGLKEGIPDITGEMIDKLVILAPASTEYNCHGWSLGSVHNIPLSSTRGNLIEEITFYRSVPDIQNKIDGTMRTLFSLSTTSILNQTTVPSRLEGAVVTYYNQNIISHTTKYLEDIQWYTYDSELHEMWYPKDRNIISFDEPGTNCIVRNYSSKLGAGHLIVHALEDIVPLYGEIGDFFDLT